MGKHLINTTKSLLQNIAKGSFSVRRRACKDDATKQLIEWYLIYCVRLCSLENTTNVVS